MVEDSPIDTYEQTMNFRHKDNLSPEFQVRMIMFDLNTLISQGRYTLRNMLQMNNILRLLAILLNCPDRYKSFDMNKYDGRTEQLAPAFCEHVLSSYSELITVAKQNGMWTINIVDEVI